MKRSKVLLSVLAGSLLVGGVTVGALSKDGKGLGEVITEQLGNGGRLLSSFKRSGEKVAKTNVSETFVKTADLMDGTKRMVFITAIDMDKDAEEAKYTRVVDGETKETPISTVYESVTIYGETWYYDAANNELTKTPQDNTYYLAVYIVDVSEGSKNKNVECFLTVNTDVTSDALEVSYETTDLLESGKQDVLRDLCVHSEGGHKVVSQGHVDGNGDLICDLCHEEAGGINNITVNMPVDRVGPGESTTLTVNVDKWGVATGDVMFSQAKGTTNSLSRIKVVDNYDNTCTVSGLSALTSSTVDNCYITATSLEDPSVSKKITFYASAFPATRIQAIKDFVGADYVLPYCTFKAVGDFQLDDSLWYSDEVFVSGYTKTSTDYLNVIKAFDNDGTWTKSTYVDYGTTHTCYTKPIAGTNEICVYDIYTDGWSNVNVYRRVKPLTEFPTEMVSTFLSGKTTSTFVEPTDGTEFTASEQNETLRIGIVGGSYSDYLDALIAANYIDCGKGNFLSPEKTLIINVSSSASGFDLAIYCDSERVIETEWTDAEKALMNQYCECVLPFFDGGFVFDYDNYYKTIATSFCLDAFNSAVAALNSDANFTAGTSTSNSASFTRTVGEKELKLTVTDEGSYYGVTIKVELVAPLPTSGDLDAWPTDSVTGAVALATDVPAASGTSFTIVEQKTGKIVIMVFGGDRLTYKNALSSAGYSSYSTYKASSVYSSYKSFNSGNDYVYVDLGIADTNGTFTVTVEHVAY